MFCIGLRLFFKFRELCVIFQLVVVVVFLRFVALLDIVIVVISSCRCQARVLEGWRVVTGFFHFFGAEDVTVEGISVIGLKRWLDGSFKKCLLGDRSHSSGSDLLTLGHTINRPVRGFLGRTCGAGLEAVPLPGCLTGARDCGWWCTRRPDVVVIGNGVHQYGNGLLGAAFVKAIAGAEFGILSHYLCKRALHHARPAIRQFGERQLFRVILGDILLQSHAQLPAASLEGDIQPPQNHTDDGQDQYQYYEFAQPHNKTQS